MIPFFFITARLRGTVTTGPARADKQSLPYGSFKQRRAGKAPERGRHPGSLRYPEILSYRPISSLTSLKQRTAKSRSSLVWPAEIWVRIRSLPLGTTG